MLRRNVDSATAEALLAESGVIRHTIAQWPGELFLLPDGRVLHAFFHSTRCYKPDGTLVQVRDSPEVAGGWLFSSLEARQEYIEGGKTASFSFAYSLPQQDRFLEQMEELSDLLPDTLDIPRADLDYSLRSLHAVDDAILRRGGKRCLEPDIFPSLIAYICLVIGRGLDVRTTMSVYMPYNFPANTNDECDDNECDDCDDNETEPLGPELMLRRYEKETSENYHLSEHASALPGEILALLAWKGNEATICEAIHNRLQVLDVPAEVLRELTRV